MVSINQMIPFFAAQEEVVTLALVSDEYEDYGSASVYGYATACSNGACSLAPNPFSVDGTSYQVNRWSVTNFPNHTNDRRFIIEFASEQQRDAFRNANLYIDLGNGSKTRSGSMPLFLSVGLQITVSHHYAEGAYTIRISPDPL